LLAALVSAAAWSDIMMAVTYNVTAVKWCLVNAEVCYLLPAWNASVDPRKGLVVVETYPYNYEANFMGVPLFYMLKMLYSSYYDLPPYKIDVYIDRPGYLWSQFSNFTVNGRSSGPWSICGGKMYLDHGYWIQSPGTYSVYVSEGPAYNVGDKLLFTEEATCATYAIVFPSNYYFNATQGWVTVTLYYLKTGRQGDIRGAWWPWTPQPSETWINGTAHLYRLKSNTLVAVGDGWYIANKTRVPTVLSLYGSYYFYGPVHFSSLPQIPDNLSYWPYGYNFLMAMAVGADPGDGVVFVKLPNSFYGRAELGYVGNETAGYFRIRDYWLAKRSTWGSVYFTIPLQRHTIVEVTLADDLYVYNTRGLACPPYKPESANPPFELAPLRMDRAREFEICNNQTSPVYVGLWVPYDGYRGGGYTFVDRVEPGKCIKARWDGQYANTDTRLDFAYTPRDFCLMQPAFSIAGEYYDYGYRYFLMPNNTLVKGPAIQPDTALVEAWKRLLQLMAQQYNETANAIKQWLQMQANMTKRLEDYYKSLPRYQDTVKMESSTSVWVNTVYNVLKTYVAPAPAAVPYGPMSVQPPPAAVAPAAAAAVAVAWAASRRDDDVVKTAAVAGIALALFGILMTLIYGSSSLTLVALGIIMAAAAAAWRKI